MPLPNLQNYYNFKHLVFMNGIRMKVNMKIIIYII
jgi:hypothetical protein